MELIVHVKSLFKYIIDKLIADEIILQRVFSRVLLDLNGIKKSYYSYYSYNCSLLLAYVFYHILFALSLKSRAFHEQSTYFYFF